MTNREIFNDTVMRLDALLPSWGCVAYEFSVSNDWDRHPLEARHLNHTLASIAQNNGAPGLTNAVPVWWADLLRQRFASPDNVLPAKLTDDERRFLSQKLLGDLDLDWWETVVTNYEMADESEELYLFADIYETVSDPESLYEFLEIAVEDRWKYAFEDQHDAWYNDALTIKEAIDDEELKVIEPLSERLWIPEKNINVTIGTINILGGDYATDR